MSAHDATAWVPVAAVTRAGNTGPWTAGPSREPLALRADFGWPEPGLVRNVKRAVLAAVTSRTSRSVKWQHRGDTWTLLVRYAVGMGDCPPGWEAR